jgi:nucleoside-diphosphate-sugar epimerase
MLIPALQGAKNIIAAIEKEPKVKHLVYTSSFAAILDLALVGTDQAVNKVFKGAFLGFLMLHELMILIRRIDDDWNPVSYEAAKASDNIGFVYCASKKLAEKVIWDYVEEKKPSWGVTTICPSCVLLV